MAPTATTTYTLSDLSGCAPPITQTIVVNPPLSITINPTTVCAGITGTISAVVTASLSPSYTWTGVVGGATTTLSTTSAMTASPTVTTTYTVNINTSSCAATVTNTITVKPNAGLALSSGAGTNGQTVCVNTAISPITYTISGGATTATVTGLPAGVTGSFSGVMLSIGGTPSTVSTQTLTSTYTVTTAGTCSQTAVTGTITVQPKAFLGLSSAIGTDNKTYCVNNALTAITYTISGGAATATVTGLPSGVTASVSSNTVTISGTPTAVSTQTVASTYTVTTSGSCVQTSTTGTITVTPKAFLGLSSAVGSDNQTLCVNTALATPITYTIAGGATTATVTGLPAGITGSFTGTTLTISGTPSTVSTQTVASTYTVTTSGTCSQTAVTGTITVTPKAFLGLSSAVGSDNQTLCVNTGVLTPITYTITGGATTATVTGLPAGITGSFTGTTLSISGTPTAVSTQTVVSTYTVSTAGTICAQTSVTGTITVTPQAFLGLASAVGSDNQTLCVNTALATPITYTISGGATTATVTGLPAGITGSFAGTTLTINGTPTAVSTQTVVSTYTVSTSGTTCSQTAVTGTITVFPKAFLGVVGAASQTLCINTPLTNITYTVSGGATGGSVTGLPAGLTSMYSSGTVTISGSPTVVGTFGYTVNTTGTCAQTSATGTIVGNPNTVVDLTSGAGSDAQKLCQTDVLSTITYSLSDGATSANVTGLPTGVTGVYSNSVVTISGTPTVLGTYNYTLTTVGGCAPVTVLGSITINSNAAIALSSGNGSDNQTLCVNTALVTPITYTISGGATTATVTGLPAGISGSFSGVTLTISGTPSTVSTQTLTSTYTVTTAGNCTQTAVTGTITVTPNAFLGLSSANGSDNQTLCVNTALATPITYTITGGATTATVTGLPAGITGSFTGTMLTISGTPTAISTQTVASTYTVTTAGTCSQTSVTGTITVTPKAFIALSSANGSDNQTLCVNTGTLSLITYTITGGATTATVTGLPAGITGSFSGTTLTIGGTPTAVSTQTLTSTYTVTTAGTCSQTSVTGTITVTPKAFIALSSAVGSDNQTLCVNTGTLSLITYTITGGATTATVTGLPAGISGSFTGTTLTLSGTPTAISTQTVASTYTVTTAGTCAQTSVTGTITVIPQAFLGLSSANGSDSQTLCVNTGTLSPITYTITGGATTATVTGLPAGITGSFSGTTLTIGGTPTTVSTQTVASTYTVTTAGTCSQTAVTGTITVTPKAFIALSSANGSDNQTLCVNTGTLSPITYTITGGATTATVTGLPAGISGSFTGTTLTLSGTPTAISTQTVASTYTVTTAGTCAQTSVTGTITVIPQAFLGLASAMGSDNQTLCVNTGTLSPITYTITGGATTATVTGLPAGITGTFSGTTLTISGTPTTVSTQTVASTYTVTTAGTCSQTSVTGTITVTPKAFIALSSANGSDNQTLCVNTGTLSPITYTITGGATTATVTGLPAGISGSFTGTTLTLSGTPTAISTQTVASTYTVTTAGTTCAQTSVTGTITVIPQAFLGLFSAVGSDHQTLCVNTASLTPITYTITGGATTATVTGLPAGITGNFSGTALTISGIPTTVSTQTLTSTYTVTTAGTCTQTSLIGTITVYPDATIALMSVGATATQTVCVRGTPITPITYTLNGGAYNASVTGLPNGVNGSYNNAGVFTISGTPSGVTSQTVAVVSTYTVRTTGSACVQKQLTGTIQLDPLPTAYAGSTSPICQTDSVSVTGASSGNGAINWTDNGQGVLSNQTTLSPQYKASTLDQGKTITLTMTVTSTNSCNVLPETIPSSVNVVVRPTLTAVPTVTASVCQNQPATATFNVTSQGTSPYVFTYTETVNGTQSTKTVTTPTVNGSTTATISAPTGITGTVVYNLTQVKDANCTQPLPVNTQTMIVNKLPTATISQNEEICRDSTAKAILFKGMNSTKPYTFTFTVNNSSAIQKGDSVYSLKPATDKVGTFVYILTNVVDSNQCSTAIQNQKATVVVHENPHAIFSVTPESTSILRPTISISDASISTTSWLWDFGDKNLSPSPNPEEHTYADTGTYRIKLHVSNGSCKDSTSEIVRITLPTTLYVPNTFSPNGDGVNDVFKAEGDGVTKFEMMVYDRWGQMVFYSTDINKGWDGKINGGSEVSMIDTYVYVINVTAFTNKHDYTYRGTVNLMK